MYNPTNFQEPTLGEVHEEWKCENCVNHDPVNFKCKDGRPQVFSYRNGYRKCDGLEKR